MVYAKRPFAGPDAVLAYLSRYTHRVAIANSRLIKFDGKDVTFKWKDYRQNGQARHKPMTLATGEFIRRFLIHVLPHGFHRIRHYGLLANSRRADNLRQARQLLAMPKPNKNADDGTDREEATVAPQRACPCCGGTMAVIEILEPGYAPRAPPSFAARRKCA